MIKYEDVLQKVISIMLKIEIFNETKDVDIECSIAENYGVDSLKLVEMIVEIETEYNFEFNYADLNQENFRSIKKIAEIIMGNLS